MTPVRRFDPAREGWWDAHRYEIDPDFPELANRFRVRGWGKAPLEFSS